MEDTLGNSLARNFFLFCSIERSPACAMAFFGRFVAELSRQPI